MVVPLKNVLLNFTAGLFLLEVLLSKLSVVSKLSIVSNTVLTDCGISFTAKGIYAYLCSCPDGWEFNVNEIAENGFCDVDTVEIGVHELVYHGYLTVNSQGCELKG